MSSLSRPFLVGLLVALIIASSYCPCVFADQSDAQESPQSQERERHSSPPC